MPIFWGRGRGTKQRFSVRWEDRISRFIFSALKPTLPNFYTPCHTPVAPPCGLGVVIRRMMNGAIKKQGAWRNVIARRSHQCACAVRSIQTTAYAVARRQSSLRRWRKHIILGDAGGRDSQQVAPSNETSSSRQQIDCMTSRQLLMVFRRSLW